MVEMGINRKTGKSLMQKARKRLKFTLGKSGKLKDIEINNGMFFLPDDFKKMFKGKSKWVLYIKKGLLMSLDEKEKIKKRKRKKAKAPCLE
jgi:hypothetical protein